MIRYVGILDGSDGVWGVRMPDLAGCHGAGANPAEAIADAASAMREWAEARIAKHLPMPNPRLWQIFCNPAKSTVPVATPP